MMSRIFCALRSPEFGSFKEILRAPPMSMSVVLEWRVACLFLIREPRSEHIQSTAVLQHSRKVALDVGKEIEHL